MKIALLHLDLAGGPEVRNRRRIFSAARQAAEAGAHWIVTPESALEGYFFKRDHPNAPVPIRGSGDFPPFWALAAKASAHLFLCCAERDAESGEDFNACFHIRPDGTCVRAHRKMYSHQSGAEKWLSQGDRTDVSCIGGVRVGVLICSDAYYRHPADMMRLKGAEMILVPAAWPPGACCPDPPAVWETCSQRAGAAVVVCNQTGRYEGMDMTTGKSAVIEGGKMLFSYQGAPAILLFDYDEKRKRVQSRAFRVLEVKP